MEVGHVARCCFGVQTASPRATLRRVTQRSTPARHAKRGPRMTRSCARLCRNPFFWMSVLMMGTTLTILGLRIHNVTSLAAFDPADVKDGNDPFGSDFAKLHGPSSRLRIERSLGALLSFCVWLRVFKYTRRIPVFGTIGRTITRAFPAVRLPLPTAYAATVAVHDPHA